MYANREPREQTARICSGHANANEFFIGQKNVIKIE